MQSYNLNTSRGPSQDRERRGHARPNQQAQQEQVASGQVAPGSSASSAAAADAQNQDIERIKSPQLDAVADAAAAVQSAEQKQGIAASST